MHVADLQYCNFLQSNLSENTGKITVGGKEYNIKLQNIAIIREAVKKLPAPFQTIQKDYNKTQYTVKINKFYQDIPYFDISVKKNKSQNTDLLSNNQIKGYGDQAFKIKVLRFNDGSNEDTLAYLVPQGQVRYTKSGSYKLGTTNVQDCVATIIQDTKTTKLAFAHVSTTTQHIIDNALDVLPKGEKNVILIGARYPDNTFNVDEILKKLLDYPYKIYIDNSYIFDNQYMITKMEDFISCYESNTNFGTITVDPRTLEITHDYPVATIKIPSME